MFDTTFVVLKAGHSRVERKHPCDLSRVPIINHSPELVLPSTPHLHQQWRGGANATLSHAKSHHRGLGYSDPWPWPPPRGPAWTMTQANPIRQEYGGKYSTTESLGEKKTALTCHVCQFLWCKPYSHGGFQAIVLTSFNVVSERAVHSKSWYSILKSISITLKQET